MNLAGVAAAQASSSSSGWPVAFIVMFGVFLVLLAVLAVFVVRFSVKLGRRTTPTAGPSPASGPSRPGTRRPGVGPGRPTARPKGPAAPPRRRPPGDSPG